MSAPDDFVARRLEGMVGGWASWCERVQGVSNAAFSAQSAPVVADWPLPAAARAWYAVLAAEARLAGHHASARALAAARTAGDLDRAVARVRTAVKGSVNEWNLPSGPYRVPRPVRPDSDPDVARLLTAARERPGPEPWVALAAHLTEVGDPRGLILARLVCGVVGWDVTVDEAFLPGVTAEAGDAVIGWTAGYRELRPAASPATLPGPILHWCQVRGDRGTPVVGFLAQGYHTERAWASGLCHAYCRLSLDDLRRNLTCCLLDGPAPGWRVFTPPAGLREDRLAACVDDACATLVADRRKPAAGAPWPHTVVFVYDPAQAAGGGRLPDLHARLAAAVARLRPDAAVDTIAPDRLARLRVLPRKERHP